MPTGGNVSNMFKDPMSRKRRLGQFYGALRIDAFEEPERFKTRLQDLADRIRREPRQDPKVAVLVPGDSEKARQADREVHGIPISSVVIEQFETIARDLKIEPLRAGRPET